MVVPVMKVVTVRVRVSIPTVSYRIVSIHSMVVATIIFFLIKRFNASANAYANVNGVCSAIDSLLLFQSSNDDNTNIVAIDTASGAFLGNSSTDTTFLDNTSIESYDDNDVDGNIDDGSFSFSGPSVRTSFAFVRLADADSFNRGNAGGNADSADG